MVMRRLCLLGPGWGVRESADGDLPTSGSRKAPLRHEEEEAGRAATQHPLAGLAGAGTRAATVEWEVWAQNAPSGRGQREVRAQASRIGPGCGTDAGHQRPTPTAAGRVPSSRSATTWTMGAGVARLRHLIHGEGELGVSRRLASRRRPTPSI